ncbi:MAG: lamin tail domain-containing protein [Bacteroidales bacterium]|nr:lamin tail domain-containing protein [Bacteroidales bacterium]
MRKILLFIISVILFQGFARAQFADSFTDGNFTSNPTWTGDVALYKVNTASQLQLNSTISETAALSAASSMTLDMEWHFWIKLAFAPSDNNLARIYLSSDQADLKGPLNGYYLKFGETGSNDAIELVQQSGNIHTVICRGTDGLLAAAFTIRIKVVRATGGSWTVYADELGGTNYKIQASGTDNTFTNGSCLGVYSKFTSSNGTRFYFDDFYAGPVIVDNTPPIVTSVQLESLNNLSVTFSEPVEASSANNINNYSTTPGSLVPQSATQDPFDPSVIHLSYAQRFTPDVVYSLDVKNVKDLVGNVMTASQTPFSWHQAKTYDILINEIMADPTPPVNLPETEYVELYNRSAFPVELQNWSLWLGTTEKVLPQYTLPAGGYVILCDDGSKPLLAPFGPVIDFSSFSVTNGSGTSTLKDFDGNVIHTASYAESWFQGSYKKDGGWSLEQIDPLNPCGESANWAACSNGDGGTPGKVNSVNASNPDLDSPSISNIIINDKTHLTVWFTESCDSATLLNTANYIIDNGIGNPTRVWTHSPDYKIADLTLSAPLVVGVDYTLTSTNNLTDCAGNAFLTEDAMLFGIPFPDTISPEVVSVSLEAINKLSVIYSEPVESASATHFNNYSSTPGSLIPVSATVDPADPTIVHLTYSVRFTPDVVYTLDIINVKDLAGNVIDSVQSPFSWHQAKTFDVLINEIMADPSPTVNLPEAEYVELYNRSAFPVDLKFLTFWLGTTEKALPGYTLPAGGYVILCDDGSKTLLEPCGSVIDFSSFSVTNGSGTLTLKDLDENIIHSVSYTEDWYQGSYKKDGGWSLELIDPLNPCGEASNWKVCSNEVGGTPGKVNSVNASNPDLVPPSVSRVGVDDPTHITVWFTETCDNLSISNVENYTVDNSIGNPVSVSVQSPGYKVAYLTLASPLVSEVIYLLTSTSNIKDCAGNTLVSSNSVRFAIPQAAEAKDIIINEMLFDPTAEGVDFVEIFNRSAKVIDLKDLILANYDTINNVITDYNQISTEPYLVFPDDYFVLSTDSSAVKKCYKTTNPKAFINMASFPSMNNEDGIVAITTKGGVVIDVTGYTAAMQYPLLTSVDGVSLERISPERASDDATNWHSAAESAGFGTPGYKNSQFGVTVTDENEITLSPDIFSPDNDGYNDYLNIAYSFNASGNNISITIYDASGRLIRNLVNHELCGTSGAFAWDGITNDRTKAMIGRYIVFVEIFDMDGNVKKYKKGTVLGGKL